MPGTPNQRSYILIGAAMALPIVVLVVVQMLFAFNSEREAIERRTLAQAEQLMQLVDAKVETDFAVMAVLATADVVDHRDWPAVYARAREIATLNPHWRDVRITDLGAREEILSLRRAYSTRRAHISEAVASEPGVLRAGGVTRDGEGCPCVYLHMPIRPGRYLLTVVVSPEAYQNLLLQEAPDGAVTAIVDHDGAFIARSIDFTDRVGTPATRYVLAAVASGRDRGIYRGVTHEGFENHTAYFTSPSTGWSTHIAIASSLLGAPLTYSFLTLAIGALAALALAAALIFWALRDLNEKRRAEERLAQTQKLEAVGQLTGGVAHDFNNLLTVMIGGLNMLLRRIEDPKQREIALHMLDAAQRGDRLTKQLLAFSRGKQMELAPVDLHALIPGMEELLRRSIDPTATLAFDLDPDARWVKTDANQLELAILNLVINARDAMPEGGRIEISAKPSRGHEDSIDLEVADNGMGMPKDVAERALEPFFTTKPAGKGTGLGLAQVFGAVRQSGGSVEIDSEPGRGTTMRLVLPRIEPPAALDEAPAQETPTPEPPAPAAEGTGPRVLVVDDEPGVRAFMTETLRNAGYAATDAEDVGVALMRLESDPPDLLLTDYSMPGMNGLELAERARARSSRLRVLIVSGYADAAALEASEVRPALLRKPFDEDALIRAVETVLAA